MKHICDSTWMGNSIQDFLWKLENVLIKKQEDNLFLSILRYMASKTSTYTGRGFSTIKISWLGEKWDYSNNRSKALRKLKEKSSCWNVYSTFSGIRLKHIKTVCCFGHFPCPHLTFLLVTYCLAWCLDIPYVLVYCQVLRFGSPHQVENQSQQRCLPKAKRTQTE